MGILEDMLKAMDRILGWKRVQEIESEVDQLSKGVADLEAKLEKENC
jgi:polyhydroxyalkanoate synthesis regulator phasin